MQGRRTGSAGLKLSKKSKSVGKKCQFYELLVYLSTCYDRFLFFTFYSTIFRIWRKSKSTLGRDFDTGLVQI